MSAPPSILTRREFLAAAAGGVLVTAGVAHAARSGAAVATATATTIHLGASLGDNSPANPEEAIAAATEQGMHAPALTLDDLPWNLRLINSDHPLPKDFEIPELRDLPEDGQSIDKRIYRNLIAMLDDAEEAGINVVVCSSFRTHKKQKTLYNNRVQKAKDEGLTGNEAKEDAAFWVAKPYHSEHEAGLAVDLVDASYQELDEGQEDTAAQAWLMEHCADYGFILRYPTDKSAITKIGYEPWHYRYVGKEHAPAITESGLCFEEWLDQYLASENAAS